MKVGSGPVFAPSAPQPKRREDTREAKIRTFVALVCPIDFESLDFLPFEPYQLLPTTCIGS